MTQACVSQSVLKEGILSVNTSLPPCWAGETPPGTQVQDTPLGFRAEGEGSWFQCGRSACPEAQGKAVVPGSTGKECSGQRSLGGGPEMSSIIQGLSLSPGQLPRAQCPRGPWVLGSDALSPQSSCSQVSLILFGSGKSHLTHWNSAVTASCCWAAAVESQRRGLRGSELRMDAGKSRLVGVLSLFPRHLSLCKGCTGRT